MKGDVLTRCTGSIQYVLKENGVKEVTEQYYLSASPYVLTGGSWSSDKPQRKTGYYLWTRMLTTYSKGEATATTPVCRDFSENAGPNLLLQTGFENDGKMGEWTTSNASESHINRLCVDGRNGYQMVASATDKTAVTILSQTLGGKLSPSTWYTLSFWVKASGLFEAVALNVKSAADTYYVDGVEKAAGSVSASCYWPANGWAAGYHTITFRTSANVGADARLSFAAYPKGYVHDGTAQANRTEAAIVMPKLERGMTATAYCANEADLTGAQGPQGIQGLQGEKGEQGIPGVGKDGRTSYFHVKYAPVGNPTDSQMTEEPDVYIGTYTDFTEADSAKASDYTWYRFQGLQGEQGKQGIPGVGKDGRTSYLHIKYSNDGGKTLTGNEGEEPGDWIGQYTDFEEDDTTNPQDYTWTKIKGETGATGAAGQDALLLDLENENVSVACDADGNVIGDIPDVNINLYKGSKLVTDMSKATVTGVFSGCTGSVSKWEVNMLTLDEDVGSVTVTCAYEGTTLTAVYTLTKVRNGRDGETATLDYLATDASVIRRTQSGTLIPASLTAKHMRKEGTSAPVQGSGQKTELTAYTSSGAKRASVNSTSGSVTMQNIAATTAYVIANLYSASGSIVDTERIPVVWDGNDGADGTDGGDGNGIESQTSYFAASDNPNVRKKADITSWGTTFPQATVNKPYVWKYVHTEYTQATATDSTPELIATYGMGSGENLLDCTGFLAANRMSSWDVMSEYHIASGSAVPTDKGRIDTSVRKNDRNSYLDTSTADGSGSSYKTMLSQRVVDTAKGVAKTEASTWYTLSFWARGAGQFDVKGWTWTWGWTEKYFYLEAGVEYIFGGTGRVDSTASGNGLGMYFYIVKPGWSQSASVYITSTSNTTKTASFTPGTTGLYYISTYAEMRGDATKGKVYVDGYILYRKDGKDADLTTVLGSGLRDTSAKVYVDGAERSMASGESPTFPLRKGTMEKHTVTFRTAANVGTKQSMEFRLATNAPLKAWLCMPKLERGMFATDYTAGPNDSRGDAGAQIRQHKDGWVSGSYTYMSGGNGEPYVDFVYLKTAKLWYRCTKTETTASPAVGDGCWEAVGQTWEVVATGLLLAENASIDFLQTNAINIYDPTTMNGASPKVQASIRGVSSNTDYPLFVGADVSGRAGAPFRVNLNGEVWMENAHINGEVQAKTGTIGGYTITENSLYAKTDPSGDDELHMTLTPQRIDFSSQNVYCGFGNNTMAAETGVTSCPLRTEVSRNFSSSTGVQMNVCHIISAEGTITNKDDAYSANGNHAVMAVKGDYAGFRMMTRRVRTSRTLDNYEGIIMCINTTDITLTLPSNPEDGKMYFVRKCAGGNITISGRIRRDFSSVGNNTVIKNNSLCILMYDAVNNWWTANVVKDEAD